MSATALGAGQRQDVKRLDHSPPSYPMRRMVRPGPVSARHGRAQTCAVDLGGATRLSLMLAPEGRGTFGEQARELMARMQTLLQEQPQPMTATSQTIFLADGRDQAECEELLKAHYGPEVPVTNFVLQQPCCGAALALEAWAVSRDNVQLRRFGRNALTVDHGDFHWIHCAGIQGTGRARPVYEQTLEALERMRGVLAEAGANYAQVVRTWFYLGNITGLEANTERYKELNRARADFYRGIKFFGSRLKAGGLRNVYPASTGIGTAGTGIVVGCTAFQTPRQDTFFVPLENPRQTPAYAYHPKYSPQSPKFSRALALVRPEFVVTWISGTASIVNSESRHEGDIEKQTKQTIDNIQRLIAPENFAARGMSGAGAGLHDLAKVRVYIKRAEDYKKCRAVCERRFGLLPAIYAIADVCRPELLVEIEGVAFSARFAAPPVARNDGEVPSAAHRK